MTNVTKKQENLQQKIVDISAQIIHEKHLYLIGLRKNKPSYNQLYKLCAEYIDLGLQNIKTKYNMEILPIKSKDSIIIDERIRDFMKSSIVEYVVFQYSFWIVRGSKRKYTITTSGIIKEGAESKLPEEFLIHYVALCGIVNELLDYGCMMALNQLHHSGVLYVDEDLIELLGKTAKEQVENDNNDTNINDTANVLFDKITGIVNTFIDNGVEIVYAIDSKASQRPFILAEFIEANEGSDVVELKFNKGKYDIVRTTGKEIDEQHVATIGRFMNAVDIIFADKIKEAKENV